MKEGHPDVIVGQGSSWVWMEPAVQVSTISEERKKEDRREWIGKGEGGRGRVEGQEGGREGEKKRK